MSIVDYCPLCYYEHTKVCDCGHQHHEHVFAGGCKVILKSGKQCDCDGYSQVKNRTLNSEK